ncbi:hypothetical protein BKA69DRAFT_515013 [Paraphysoderma sedebokerense]|nr:hypothetical protein BKA69DRAFT_515013 [Paraphysoderma sedebokerense]
MFAESNDANSSVLVVESCFIPEEQLQIVKNSLGAVYAGSITFEQLGRLDSIPFSPSSYDIILSGTIIPAFPHSPSILNRYAFVLRPGGFLHLKELIFIGDPVPAGTQLAPLKTQKDIAAAFQIAGFVDIDVSIGSALSDKEVLDFVCRCWNSSTDQAQILAQQLSQQLAVAEVCINFADSGPLPFPGLLCDY